MSYVDVVMLIGVGLFGGAWNSIAGGATLFVFPALMAVGLPPVVANATNVLALMPANAAALLPYRKELRAVGPAIWPLLFVSGAGAITGSFILIVSDPAVFETLIPWLVLVATLLFAFSGRLRRWVVSRGPTGAVPTHGALYVGSIYGGYFGAGLGFVLLALAQIMGFREFHTANAIKNLLSTVFMILSVIVFAFGDLIAWPEALVTMIGTTFGGFLGGRIARHVDPRILHRVVIGFGTVLCIYYFGRAYEFEVPF